MLPVASDFAKLSESELFQLLNECAPTSPKAMATLAEYQRRAAVATIEAAKESKVASRIATASALVGAASLVIAAISLGVML